eukprot:1159181-Pelagomonas_calceolata.AAC.3
MSLRLRFHHVYVETSIQWQMHPMADMHQVADALYRMLLMADSVSDAFSGMLWMEDSVSGGHASNGRHASRRALDGRVCFWKDVHQMADASNGRCTKWQTCIETCFGWQTVLLGQLQGLLQRAFACLATFNAAGAANSNRGGHGDDGGAATIADA